MYLQKVNLSNMLDWSSQFRNEQEVWEMATYSETFLFLSSLVDCTLYAHLHRHHGCCLTILTKHLDFKTKTLCSSIEWWDRRTI